MIGTVGDWSFLADVTWLNVLQVLVAGLVLLVVVIGVMYGITEWLDHSEAKYFRQHQLREAREFRDEFKRTKPSRPCDVCNKQPTTLYFDGYSLVDLCHACAAEAAEAGIRG